MLASVFNHTTFVIAGGSALLGAVSGALGSFAVLRRQSLIGDAISHAALPGIVLAFMLTGANSPLVLMTGAAVAGLAGMLVVMGINQTTRLRFDSALGLVLSVFFGLGLVLLTFIQRTPDAAQAGLDRFLFGQAAALLRRDVWGLAIIGAITLALVAIFWKEFKLLAFDAPYGTSLGLPMRRLDLLLTGLVTIAIVMGLQTVGVVLMSAMIVAPAAAARQWCNSLGNMVMLAGAFGALSGIVGAVASSVVSNLPTGPSVVLAMGMLVLFSLLFAPQRGLISEWHRRRKSRRRLRLDGVLTDLYELEEQHQSVAHHGHTARAIQAMSFGEGSVRASLVALEEQDLVKRLAADEWTITASGRKKVQQMLAGLGHPEQRS